MALASPFQGAVKLHEAKANHARISHALSVTKDKTKREDLLQCLYGWQNIINKMVTGELPENPLNG